MTDDPFDLDEWYDETELDYCPRCGSALEGEFPVECPEHGSVIIDYSEFTDDEFLDEIFAHAGDEEWLEMMFGADVDSDGPLFDEDLIEDIFGATPEEMEREEREQSSGGGVRDRINRLIGRGR